MWDKRGENITYKFYKLLREQSETDKKLAIIVGDSQAGISGRALESILKQNDYDVIRKFKSGSRTSKVGDLLSQISVDRPVSLVAIFSGGNDSSANEASNSMTNLINYAKEKFGNPEIVLGVVPPAMTGDSNKIKKVFGRSSHSPEFKDRREGIAYALKKVAEAEGVSYFDPREFITNPDSITTGDGIHLTGEMAQSFAQGVASKVTGRLNAQTPISSKKADYKSGRRLSDQELENLNVVEKANYAKARSNVCKAQGNLTLGSEGEMVKSFQNTLKEKGFNVTDPEGVFGESTLINSIVFQMNNDLRQDGCIGPITLRKAGHEVKTLYAGSTEIIDIIRKAAQIYNVPEDFMLAMAILESNLNPRAKSPTGARGLFQFITSTGNTYGLYSNEDFYDPIKNSDAAGRLTKTNISAVEALTNKPINDNTEYLVYIAHNQGIGGMRQIYKSARSGGKQKIGSRVLKNMSLQGRGARNAMLRYPNNPGKGFLEYFREVWSRKKDRALATLGKAEEANS